MKTNPTAALDVSGSIKQSVVTNSLIKADATGQLVAATASDFSTPDATTSALGKVQLAGDLSGTASAPTVPGLLLKAPLDSPGLTGNRIVTGKQIGRAHV